MLLSRIRGEAAPLQQVTISPELILRESCAPVLDTSLIAPMRERSLP
jgi:hypothetical protein